MTDEIDRLLEKAGVTGRVEGQKLYVSRAEYAKLYRWFGETWEYPDEGAAKDRVEFEVVVEDTPNE